MKLSNKLFLFTIIFLFNSNLSYASSIDNIKVLDENNVNFSVSQDVLLPVGKLQSELKVMKDINVSFVSKDFEDKNKLILNLTSDLQVKKSYSLITILGPDGNMDFVTGESIEDSEIQNTLKTDSTSQGINRIVILNSRTIEIYYNNIVTDDELEFKLFNELSINEIKVVSQNNINVLLNDKFEKLSNYILMILSIQDNYGNFIKLDEDLYDLSTTAILQVGNQENEATLIPDELNQEIKQGTGSIEDVALNSAETPDTGPETTVLIILTFILNTIFIFRKKFINK